MVLITLVTMTVPVNRPSRGSLHRIDAEGPSDELQIELDCLKKCGFRADRYEGPIGLAGQSRASAVGPAGMRDLDSIRRFVYREPRMATGFPVDFLAGGSLLRGLCRDVSEAGLRAEFDDPLILGDTGLLILRPPTGVLELRAQIAYIEKRQVGLFFLFETDWERRMTVEFVAAIANDAGTAPIVRL
jgi:PilZ domain